jgi:hypothetical protein
MQITDFKIVSRPCTDDRITLPHPIARTKHKLSCVEKRVERTKSRLEDLPEHLLMVDLLLFHGSGFSMAFKVIFQRNGKKGSNDVCMI